MAEYQDLDVIDDNNTARFPEGQAPSTVNDGARAGEGMTARWYRDTQGTLVTTGTSSAYEITTNRTVSAYYDGLEIVFIAHVSCDATPTLKVGTLAAVPIKLLTGDDLVANDMRAGVNSVIYSGGSFALTSTPGNTVVVPLNEGEIIQGGIGGIPEALANGTKNFVLGSNGTTMKYFGGVDSKTANYTVVDTDHGKLILVDATTGPVTVSLTAAATLGAWFYVEIKKKDSSANAVTIDPNGSEQIDGQSTYVLSGANQSAGLTCDGSNFFLTKTAADSIVLVAKATANNSATVELTGLSGYSLLTVVGSNIRPATDNVRLRCRLSDNNGSTYYSGASDYRGDTSDQAYMDIVPPSVDGSSNTANEFVNLEANFHLPDALAYTYKRSWYGQVRFSGNVQGRINYQFLKKAVAVDAIQFYMSSGNIAEGQFSVYGIQ